jgi:hypothetical protein
LFLGSHCDVVHASDLSTGYFRMTLLDAIRNERGGVESARIDEGCTSPNSAGVDSIDNHDASVKPVASKILRNGALW